MNNEEIRNYIDEAIKNHTHNGVDSQLINVRFISLLFDTVNTVPSHTPQNIFEQIKIYNSGGTYRLYWYDTNLKQWHYAVGV